MFRKNLVKAVQLWIEMGRPRVAPISQQKEKLLRKCPSSSPVRGERVFARRNVDGQLSFEISDVPMDADLDAPTRYVGKCFEKRCVYWAGHCQLGAMVTRVAIRNRDELRKITDPRGSCSIKDSCRWIYENGPDACMGCPEVDYIMSQPSLVPELAHD